MKLLTDDEVEIQVGQTLYEVNYFRFRIDEVEVTPGLYELWLTEPTCNGEGLSGFFFISRHYHDLDEAYVVLRKACINQHMKIMGDVKRCYEELKDKLRYEIKSADGTVITTGPSLREAIEIAYNTKASLEGADLRGADLSRMSLVGVNLNGADLTGANLSGADLRRALLGKTLLANADLSGAILCGAILCGADLSNARVDDTDFTGAHLHDADLRGTPLNGAHLFKANLFNVKLD